MNRSTRPGWRAACAVLAVTWLTTTGRPATASDPHLVREPVTYPNGSLTLAAELVLPDPSVRRPVPGAVLLQGSGGGLGTTRHNGWTAEMADMVAASGVAVLLTDKRGTGLSDGDWRTASIDDLAGDARAGVRYLGTRVDVDDSRIGLIGMSQGGHVAPRAANGGDDVAFVISVSASMTPLRETLYHELEQTYRGIGHDDGQIDDLQELTRYSFLYLDTGRHFDRYLEVRRRIASSYHERYVETWPDDPDAYYWAFWRGVKDFDPIPDWQQIVKGRRLPVFVAYGELDEHDNVPVADSLRRIGFHLSDPLLRCRVYSDTGHGLADPDREPGTSTYHPAFRADLAAWLDAFVQQARDG